MKSDNNHYPYDPYDPYAYLKEFSPLGTNPKNTARSPWKTAYRGVKKARPLDETLINSTEDALKKHTTHKGMYALHALIAAKLFVAGSHAAGSIVGGCLSAAYAVAVGAYETRKAGKRAGLSHWVMDSAGDFNYVAAEHNHYRQHRERMSLVHADINYDVIERARGNVVRVTGQTNIKKLVDLKKLKF